MKIAIVNDSQMAVESLRRVVASVPRYQVTWTAGDGVEAVENAAKDTPDLILMDLIMPVMNGVQATRRIMQDSPCAIVIVTATVTGNSAMVFEAMGAGALDAVNTPILGSGEGAEKLSLIEKINNVERLLRGSGNTQARPQPLPEADETTTGGQLVAIGASTGGPTALARILSQFPTNFPAAVAVVQHVDARFAPGLAEWLNSQIALPARLAVDGDRLLPGTVLIAGGEQHMVLGADGVLRYDREPADYAYRPSVDVFFQSLARHWTQEAVGVLLTGMGRDGAMGLLSLRSKGCHTIAQDQETSAVYGMPKEAARLNAASEILPLEEIGAALSWYVSGNAEHKSKADVP